MLKAKGRWISVGLVTSDVITIVGSLYLAHWLRFNSGLFDVTKGALDLGHYKGLTLALVIAWLLVFRWTGLYERRKGLNPIDEIYSVIIGVSLGAMLVLVAAFLFQSFWYSRLLLGLHWFLAIVFISLARCIIRFGEARLRAHGIGVRRAALLGSLVEVERLAGRFEPRATGYQILGWISVNPSVSSETSELPCLGSLEALDRLVEAKAIVELIVISTSVTPSQQLEILTRCEPLGIEVKLFPSFPDMIVRRGEMEEVAGVPLIAMSRVPLRGWNRTIKRLIDLAASFLLLILLSPLLAVTAIAVRLSSPGRIIFRQERIGLDGRTFVIYKFRTLREGSEKKTNQIWAPVEDPRRTHLGSWLRRLSLDELPQLVNVLKGNMSLVGPRPELPHFTQQFSEKIPGYMERHRVQTGLTGWAQVNGLRGNCSVEERLVYDLYYVENWSLALDLKILIKTAFEFLFHKQAR